MSANRKFPVSGNSYQLSSWITLNFIKYESICFFSYLLFFFESFDKITDFFVFCRLYILHKLFISISFFFFLPLSENSMTKSWLCSCPFDVLSSEFSALRSIVFCGIHMTISKLRQDTPRHIPSLLLNSHLYIGYLILFLKLILELENS